MNMPARILFAAACAAVSTGLAGAAPLIDVERMNGGRPIISKAHFAALGVPGEGRNINGPSLVRVPDWIGAEDRAHPEAVYYLYFADHGGKYIRLAWAAGLEGPWVLHRSGAHIPPGARGVLDLGADDAIAVGPGIEIFDHVASPDVHLDAENKRFIMYFHAPARHDGERTGQETLAATSADGLNFNPETLGGQAGHGIRPALLGRFYFRAFTYSGGLYAIGNFGRLYRAPNPDDPWTPPADHDVASYLWTEGRNPFREALLADGVEDVYPRHFAVRVDGDTLYAFYTRIGDAPERILLSTIDLSAGGGDWMQWTPSYPPEEILRAELPWEGGDLEIEASRRGRVYGGVNQLRDPCLFQDDDGSWYLLYSGQGEDAMGIARLHWRGE